MPSTPPGVGTNLASGWAKTPRRSGSQGASPYPGAPARAAMADLTPSSRADRRHEDLALAPRAGRQNKEGQLAMEKEHYGTGSGDASESRSFGGVPLRVWGHDGTSGNRQGRQGELEGLPSTPRNRQRELSARSEQIGTPPRNSHQASTTTEGGSFGSRNTAHGTATEGKSFGSNAKGSMDRSSSQKRSMNLVGPVGTTGRTHPKNLGPRVTPAGSESVGHGYARQEQGSLGQPQSEEKGFGQTTGVGLRRPCTTTFFEPPASGLSDTPKENLAIPDDPTSQQLKKSRPSLGNLYEECGTRNSQCATRAWYQ